ncbi:MAG: hypothetical protein WDW36_000870 [Sanguina aurantia]
MAAVLVPLFEDDQGVVRVVLTQRCSNMRSHGGEVCLPGGKRDPADGGDDVVTALREAQEELGLDPATATVLLSLPPLLSKHYLSVTPVIATIPASFVPTPSPHEVAAVFTVPLELFLGTPPGHSSARTTSPQAPAAATTPGLSSDSLPALPAPATNAAAQAAPPSSSSATTPSAPAAAADAALPHSGSAGEVAAVLACGEAQHTWLDVEWAGISYRMHSFDHQGFRIWGLTAAILIQVACAAFNRLLTGDVVLLEMSASPA